LFGSKFTIKGIRRRTRFQSRVSFCVSQFHHHHQWQDFFARCWDCAAAERPIQQRRLAEANQTKGFALDIPLVLNFNYPITKLLNYPIFIPGNPAWITTRTGTLQKIFTGPVDLTAFRSTL
jgi:hypothetical protein